VVFDHGDPALRPFIEVEAKIAREILREGRAAGSPAREIVAAVADAATEDAERGARELSEQLPQTRRLLPVCQEGCSYCCYATAVHASTPEILRVASYVKATRSPEDVAKLRERAEETAKKIAPLDLAGRAHAKVPCPLLDVATGRCTVYDVRPVPCRAYHSGSVEACKKAHDEGDANPILPINPALFHVAHAYGFGMLTGCASEGLDVGPYDLAAALPAALASDLDERWLEGERVFSHTIESARAREGYQAVLDELVRDLGEGRLDDAARVRERIDGAQPEAQRRERNRQKRTRRARKAR
jgi:Fe-S-cluster containining protein